MRAIRESAFLLEGCGVSWLKLDDRFARHPKILELSEVQRWRWVTLLLEVASHASVTSCVTSRMLQEARLDRVKLLELGLLDANEDGSLSVHDWSEYNGYKESAALRQKRYRMRLAGVDEATVLEVAPPKERYVVSDVSVTSHSYARVPVPSRNTALHKPRLGTTERDERLGGEDGSGDDGAGDAATRVKLPQVDEEVGW